MKGEITPRVAIYDNVDEHYVAIFYGEGAEERASDLIVTLPDPRDGDRYDYSVSDDSCADCGELFSSEARERTGTARRGHWVCPVCGGDPKPAEALTRNPRTGVLR